MKATNLDQKLLDYELVETGNERREDSVLDIPGQYEERRPAAKVFDSTSGKKAAPGEGDKAARKAKVKQAITRSKSVSKKKS